MGKILSLTGASGAGKTTIAKALVAALPQARMVVSYTTRKSRPTDIVGEYDYLTDTAFDALNTTSPFLWTASRPEVRFGTTANSILEIVNNDKAIGIMILVPDAVEKLRDYLTSIGKVALHTPVFIVSPRPQILSERLRGRDGGIEDTRRRSAEADWEERARGGDVPFHFIRNDTDVASVVRAVIALL